MTPKWRQSGGGAAATLHNFSRRRQQALEHHCVVRDTAQLQPQTGEPHDQNGGRGKNGWYAGLRNYLSPNGYITEPTEPAAY